MGETRTAVRAEVADLQADLFAQGEPGVRSGTTVRRWTLDERCWVDTVSRWVTGGDQLLLGLAETLRWTSAEREMYGRTVAEPRLGAFVRPRTAGSVPVIDDIAAALTRRYRRSFDSVWVNYYRGGQDSVAWHGDRIGIDPADALVAIVSLGGPRRFLMRPRGGGGSRSFTLASGDLLVMGGACQQRWEHSVPKVAAAPPRMSVTLRPTMGRMGR